MCFQWFNLRKFIPIQRECPSVAFCCWRFEATLTGKGKSWIKNHTQTRKEEIKWKDRELNWVSTQHKNLVWKGKGNRACFYARLQNITRALLLQFFGVVVAESVDANHKTAVWRFWIVVCRNEWEKWILHLQVGDERKRENRLMRE